MTTDIDKNKLVEGNWCRCETIELYEQIIKAAGRHDVLIEKQFKINQDLSYTEFSDGAAVIPCQAIGLQDLQIWPHEFIRRAINTFGTPIQIRLSEIDQLEKLYFQYFDIKGTTELKVEILGLYLKLMKEKLEIEGWNMP